MLNKYTKIKIIYSALDFFICVNLYLATSVSEGQSSEFHTH